MGLEVAVAILTYLIILVIAYVFIALPNEKEEKEERGYKIIDKAFQNAYFILIFCKLVVAALVLLPHIPTDFRTTSYLILASKFVSIVTLAGSIFVLSKKICKD